MTVAPAFNQFVDHVQAEASRMSSVLAEFESQPPERKTFTLGDRFENNV